MLQAWSAVYILLHVIFMYLHNIYTLSLLYKYLFLYCTSQQVCPSNRMGLNALSAWNLSRSPSSFTIILNNHRAVISFYPELYIGGKKGGNWLISWNQQAVLSKISESSQQQTSQSLFSNLSSTINFCLWSLCDMVVYCSLIKIFFIGIYGFTKKLYITHGHIPLHEKFFIVEKKDLYII